MKTVVHLTSGRDSDATHALAAIEDILDDDSVDLEGAVVVATGDGVYAFLEGSKHADRIVRLAERDVSFMACERSVEERGLDGPEFHRAVERIPTGVGELTRRQSTGSTYVKIP